MCDSVEKYGVISFSSENTFVPTTSHSTSYFEKCHFKSRIENLSLQRAQQRQEEVMLSRKTCDNWLGSKVSSSSSPEPHNFENSINHPPPPPPWLRVQRTLKTWRSFQNVNAMAQSVYKQHFSPNSGNNTDGLIVTIGYTSPDPVVQLFGQGIISRNPNVAPWCWGRPRRKWPWFGFLSCFGIREEIEEGDSSFDWVEDR